MKEERDPKRGKKELPVHVGGRAGRRTRSPGLCLSSCPLCQSSALPGLGPECPKGPSQAGITQQESWWAPQMLPSLMPPCADEKSKNQRQRGHSPSHTAILTSRILKETSSSSLKPGKARSRGRNQSLLGECMTEGPLAGGRYNGQEALPVHMLYVLFRYDDQIDINKYLFTFTMCQILCSPNGFAITLQDSHHSSDTWRAK